MVMGLAPVAQASERFEEGSDSDFQDAEEPTARELLETHDNAITETIGSGEFHGDMAAHRYESVLR